MMLQSIGSLRKKLSSGGWIDADRLLIGVWALACWISCLGFLLGGSVSGWLLPSVIGAALVLSAWASWRKALAFGAVLVGIGSLAVYTFPYVHWDAVACHVPLEHAFADGWNPIYGGTKSGLMAFLSGMARIQHMLAAAKMTALCSSLVSSGIGTFSSSAFPGYSFLVVLCCSAYRFARAYWGCGRFQSAVFAVLVSLPVRLVHQMTLGLVDFNYYALALTAVFSGWLWLLRRRMVDLCQFWIVLPVVALVKPSGVVVYVVLAMMMMALDRTSQSFKWAGISLCLLLVGGMILYFPVISGGVSDLKTLTDDFGANEDGLRMGYLARITYAWLSPHLSRAACSLWYGKPDFTPLFTNGGGAEMKGLGEGFAILLGLSMFGIWLTRRKGPGVVCLVLFCISNLSPLQYIGYARYFPLVRLIPVLAAFHLTYDVPARFKLVSRCLRWGIMVACSGLALLSVWSCLALWKWQFETEGLRQVQLTAFFDQVASECRASYPVKDVFGCTLSRRLEAAGISSVSDEAPTLAFSATPFLIPASDEADAEAMMGRWWQDRPLPLCLADLAAFSPSFKFVPTVLFRKVGCPK